MAEERDSLENAVDETTGRTPAEIEREIERTRADMSETIDSIQQRFSPSYIRQQVTDEVKQTAREAGISMIETIKQNPLPALIAGLSIGWLFMKGRNPDVQQHSYYTSNRYMGGGNYSGPDAYRSPYYGGSPYAAGYASGYAYGNQPPHEGMRERAGEMVDDVREKATDVADQVRERAGEMADDVRERMHYMADQAQYNAQRASTWVDRLVHENPVAVGALALAAGAAIGLAMPGTEAENRFMGEHRDTLMERAGEAARGTLEKVEAVAEKTIEHVKEVAQDVKETVKSEAESQGLVGSR